MNESVFNTEMTALEYLSLLYDKNCDICVGEARLMETPADIARKEEDANIEKKARELLELGILDEGAVGEYYTLDSEIRIKKDNIKKLYGIEASDMSLKALEGAKKDYCESHIVFVDELNETSLKQMREIQDNYDRQTDELTLNEETELNRIRKEISELESESDREFEREQVQYEYTLDRERKLEEDKRTLLVEERERQLSDRERAAKGEKEACINRIAEIDKMTDRVDGVQALLDEAKEKGAMDEEAALQRTFAYETELREAGEKHKIQSIQSDYDALKDKYDQLNAEISDLNTRLDQCNAESRKLTSDTVKSIGGINILNSERKKRTED